MTINKEILDEFDDYSDINYYEPVLFEKAAQHLNANSLKGGWKKYRGGFGVKQKAIYTDYKRNQYGKIELFAKTLIKFKNLKYAKKVSGLGYANCRYYIEFLNKSAIDRGMPLIFIKKEKWARPNVKLNEKQISFIKYLVTKYSTYKVAKIYNVNQSTIHQIKTGMTWKSVIPAIINKNPIIHINQYK